MGQRGKMDALQWVAVVGLGGCLLLSGCHGNASGSRAGWSGGKSQPDLIGLPYSAQSFSHLLIALDANHDAAISRGELETYLGERYLLFDANADGVVTREEFGSAEQRDAALQRFRQQYMDRLFGQLDVDADGRLTRTELLSVATQRFTRTDVDGGGRITEEDLAPPGPPSSSGGMRGRGRGFGGPPGGGF